MLLGLTLVFAVAFATACDPSIDGCAECDSAGKICTKCTAGSGNGSDKEYLTVDGRCLTGAECVAIQNHYVNNTVDDSNGRTCRACSTLPGCEQCANDGSACTKCNPEVADGKMYLKSGSCVTAEECSSGAFFPNDALTSGTKTCDACNSVCAACSGGLASACTKCNSGGATPYLKKENPSDSTGTCVSEEACQGTAGYYADGANADAKECKKCNVSCVKCSGSAENLCTACYPGSVLNKIDSSTAGTCIPECTGRYAENCETGMCTAVLGGSKYCSRCKSGYVPVDGLCVSATTRAPTGCTSKGDGTCASCTSTYFKESGGCYLSTAYPGNTLCSQAANGQCSQCANGQTQSGGSCPACDPTCATCETTNVKECKTCFSGYYFDATNKACRKCSENSTDITGVPNCVSCTVPSGNSGPVTCYVTQEPTVDPTDPSVNKTGLSSGAIAGISVAVIAVVGGLAGFLCWWFLCRGKA